MNIIKTGLTFLTFAAFSIEALSGTFFSKNAIRVASYDTDTGELINSFPILMGGSIRGGIAASEDRLFISDEDGVNAYSHDGQLLYQMDAPTFGRGGVAYGDGKVFSTDGEMIFISDAQSGMNIDMFPSIIPLGGISSFTYVPSANEVPVPAAAWLFGSALAGLSVVRRKK